MAIISVKEARKLLGKDYRHYSDEQISELIEQTNELAKLSLEVAKNKVLKEKYGQKPNLD